jgi:hypothetical protein
MGRSSSSGSGGVGLLGLLGLMFVFLKLGGVIAWPWIWVLAPLWVPTSIALIALLAIFVFALFYG